MKTMLYLSKLPPYIIFPFSDKQVFRDELTDRDFSDLHALTHFNTHALTHTKALRHKLFFVKALSKRLQKLMIKTKRLLRFKFLSFVDINI